MYKRDNNRAQDEQIVIGNVVSCVHHMILPCLLLPAAKPEVTVKQLTADHEFIVLACDGKVMEGVAITHVITGIWDVMTNEEVLEFVRSAIADGTLPDIVSCQVMCVLIENILC